MAAGSPGTWMTALASPVGCYLTQRYGERPVVGVGVILTTLIGWGFSEVSRRPGERYCRRYNPSPVAPRYIAPTLRGTFPGISA